MSGTHSVIPFDRRRNRNLPGREPELAMVGDWTGRLLAAGASPHPSGPGPLILFGPDGIGKSALLRAAHAQAQAAGADATLISAGDLMRDDAGRSLLDGRLFEMMSRSRSAAPRNGWKYGGHERIVQECRRRPKALLIDDAHLLGEEAAARERAGDGPEWNAAVYVYNVGQDLWGDAPFMMLAAGRPELPFQFLSVGAGFMTRAASEALGPLSPDGSLRAASAMLAKRGLDINGAAEAMAEDAGGYPPFLRMWAEELAAGAERSTGPELLSAAREEVRARREDFCRERLRGLDEPDRRAAATMARAFEGKASLRRDEALAALGARLDDRGAYDRARKAVDALARRDLFWETMRGEMDLEPAVPGLLEWIRERERGRERGAGDDLRPD